MLHIAGQCHISIINLSYNCYSYIQQLFSVFHDFQWLGPDQQTQAPRLFLSNTYVSKHQWPFQEPKLEVPTIYKAYSLGLCKGISPPKYGHYGTVLPFWDPEIPIDITSEVIWV